MGEIKLGEYCRTKGGHIHKVTRIDNNKLVYWGRISCGWSIEQLKDIVVKHSPNIIDLIEVGDYVNGERVTEIKDGKIVEICDYFGTDWENDDIKSIVTKEQFNNIKYEV